MEEAQVGKKDYDPKMMREVRDRVLSGELKMKQAAHEHAEYGVKYVTVDARQEQEESLEAPGQPGQGLIRGSEVCLQPVVLAATATWTA